MPIAKVAVDAAGLPTFASYDAAQAVVAKPAVTLDGQSRRDLALRKERLEQEWATLDYSHDELTRVIDQTIAEKDRLTVEIDAAKADVVRLEDAIPASEDLLLSLEAEAREMARELDEATRSKLDLEAAYPVLARPVPELPPEVRAWAEAFQKITPNQDVSRSIHKTYFLAVSKVQDLTPRLRRLETERDKLRAEVEGQRRALETARAAIPAGIERARKLKLAITEEYRAQNDAEMRLEEIAEELPLVEAALMSVEEAMDRVAAMRSALDTALGQIIAKVQEVQGAVAALPGTAVIGPLAQAPDSYSKRLSAELAETEFLRKSLGKGEVHLVLGRMPGLIDAADADVEAVNAAARAKLSVDRLPKIKADALLRAQTEGAKAHEGGPIPHEDLLVPDDVLAMLEKTLDDVADISTLGPEIDARIAESVKQILRGRASAAAAEAQRLLKEARSRIYKGVVALKDDPAFAELDPTKRGRIVWDEAAKVNDGGVTVASVTLMLQNALEAQYTPNTETWKKVLGIIGKSFPDSGKKHDGYTIHVSFFKGNLSASASGGLRVRNPDGSAVDVPTLLTDLLMHATDTSRVHATLEVNGKPTPKVYFDGLNTTAPSVTRYFGDWGYGAPAMAAVKAALVHYLNTVIKPKLQAFVDRHGRPA